MAITRSLELLDGWSLGYWYAESRSYEIEVRQGENYLMASPRQWLQASNVATLGTKLVNATLKGTALTISKIAFVILPIIALPVFVFSAAVKQRYYPNIAKFWNTHSWANRVRNALGHLPPELSAAKTRVFHLITDHAGTICQISMVVISIALSVFGQPFFGGSVLFAGGYQILDSKGFIPRKISLFMETYMPVVSGVGLLISGSIINGLVGAILLVTSLSPSINQIIQQKIDSFVVTHFFKNQEIRLAEVESPVVLPTNLSFDQIMGILRKEEHEFSINPTHPSKWLPRAGNFPENRNLDLFQNLFAGVDWTGQSRVVISKLRDDERFRAELQSKFPDSAHLDFKELDVFTSHFRRAGEQVGMDEAAYAARCLQANVIKLLSILKGETRVTGSQQYLDEAIRMMYQIIPYLQELDRVGDNVSKIEKADIILKLAIEGGDYCALGIKRASSEVISTMMAKQRVDLADPLLSYEQGLLGSLQNKRHRILQEFYQASIQRYLPPPVRDDIHAFDTYKKGLSLGFYPLTTYERRQFDLNDLYFWEIFRNHRSEMMKAYSSAYMDSLGECDRGKFAAYILLKIGSLTALTEAQKEVLRDIWTITIDEMPWDPEQNEERFFRLVLVLLGVLKVNATF